MKSEIENNQKIFLKSSILFGAYTFALMMSLVLIQKQSALFADEIWFIRDYYLVMICIAIGFILSAYYKKIVKIFFIRRILLGMASGTVILCSFLTVYPPNSSLFYVCTLVYGLGIGFVGGNVYNVMSVLLHRTNLIGKSMGIGASAALIFQYFFQYKLNNIFLEHFLILISIVMIFVILSAQFSNLVFEDRCTNIQTGQKAGFFHKTVYRSILVTLCLEVFGFYYDFTILNLLKDTHMEGNSIYNWPRLFGIVSYLLIGFIGDIKKCKYVPIATLCLTIPCLITPLISLDSPRGMLNMAVFYIGVMARISFFNLMFWEAAPETKNPQLWSGMGRIISNLVEPALSLIGFFALSGTAMIALELVVLVFMILVLTLFGDMSILDVGKENEKKSFRNEEIVWEALTLEKYQEKFHLTQKEKEVMDLLISTEDNLQELADKMGISRRVLQKYITSIYEKTETKTRVGLLRSYTEYLSNKGK